MREPRHQVDQTSQIAQASAETRGSASPPRQYRQWHVRCLFGALVLLILSGCGGAGLGGYQPHRVTPVSGVRFDLSDAVGVQIGTVSGVGRSASASSGLVKVTATGEVADPLVEGQVRVEDVFIRNGKVYLLLDRYSVACVLGEIGPDNQLRCLDDQLESLDLRSLQFDAHGGVFYSGSLHDGSRVIRRAIDGATRDYYVARDVIEIYRFVATREGDVIVQGMTRGGMSNQEWLRLIDSSGRVTQLPMGYLGPHLPDGTILVEFAEGSTSGPGRFIVQDGVSVDHRSYCETLYSLEYTSNARHLVPYVENIQDGCSAVSGLLYEIYAYSRNFWNARSPWERLAISGEAVVVASESGVFRLYPHPSRVDLPLASLQHAILRGQLAVVSGMDESNAPRAYLIDLRDDRVTDMLGTRRIEVLSMAVELDRNRVMLYGLDLDRNQPVLGEYDLSGLAGLQTADVQGEFASSFQVLDWTINHVPAPPATDGVQLEFGANALSGWEQGLVRFDVAATPRLPWVDLVSWDFGDGTVLEIDASNYDFDGFSTVHGYAEPGTYVVTMTATDQFGVARSTTVSVTVHDVLAIATIAARGSSWAGLDDLGDVWTWGTGAEGQLGDGTVSERAVPTRISVPTSARIVQVSNSGGHVVALDADGDAWAWGRGSGGALGNGSTSNALTPVRVMMPSETRLLQVEARSSLTVAVDTAGSLWWWGSGAGSTPVPVSVPEGVTFVETATNGTFSLALDLTGRVWSWGYNWNGELGDGTLTHRPTEPHPVHVPTGVRITRVSIGSSHALAIADDGRVFGWGRNAYGELGGTAVGSSLLVPTVIAMPDTSAIVDIVASEYRSFALDANGTVWSLGPSSESGLPLTTQMQPLPGLDIGSLHRAEGPSNAVLSAVDTLGRPWVWDRLVWRDVGGAYALVHRPTRLP